MARPACPSSSCTTRRSALPLESVRRRRVTRPVRAQGSAHRGHYEAVPQRDRIVLLRARFGGVHHVGRLRLPQHRGQCPMGLRGAQPGAGIGGDAPGPQQPDCEVAHRRRPPGECGPAMPAADRLAGHDRSTWMSSSPRYSSGAVDNHCCSSDFASGAYAFTVCGDRPRSSPRCRVYASSTSSNGAGRSLLTEAAVDSGGT